MSGILMSWLQTSRKSTASRTASASSSCWCHGLLDPDVCHCPIPSYPPQLGQAGPEASRVVIENSSGDAAGKQSLQRSPHHPGPLPLASRTSACVAHLPGLGFAKPRGLSLLFLQAHSWSQRHCKKGKGTEISHLGAQRKT